MKRRVIWFAVTGLVLTGMCFLPGEMNLHLVIGWLLFLHRVLPRITADPTSLAVGLGASVLFAGGLQLAGRWWMGRRAKPGVWKVRWTLTVMALVVLLFGSGIAVVGIAHQVGWIASSREPLMGPALKFRPGHSEDNLKWLGISVLNLQDTYPKGSPYPRFRENGTMLHGWALELLPFIGYSTPGLKRDLPWNHPDNQPIFKSVLPIFINPDFVPAQLTDDEGYGLNHYAANVRVMGAKPVAFSQITNGAANTLLIGEVNANFKPWGHPANWRDPQHGMNTTPHGFGGPKSRGGALFVMADGSVRFISDRTSPEVIRALSNPRAQDSGP
jgi:hypothetical protein